MKVYYIRNGKVNVGELESWDDYNERYSCAPIQTNDGTIKVSSYNFSLSREIMEHVLEERKKTMAFWAQETSYLLEALMPEKDSWNLETSTFRTEITKRKDGYDIRIKIKEEE